MDEHRVLEVHQLGDGRWSAPHPDEDPEKRDVVFSGQLLAQMIMAAVATDGSGKEVKSIHAVFARTGAYSVGPMEYRAESMHSGRAWGSVTVTGQQGDRLVARSLVLLNTVEHDLIRHATSMPDVPAPEACDVAPILVVYPGTEVRPVHRPGACNEAGAPTSFHWVRLPNGIDTEVRRQAAVAWCQPGFTIGTAVQAHPDVLRIGDSHRSVSTGVISHTAHFHDPADTDDWLLVVSAAEFAGNGRVYGHGSVFGREGALVATFGQDAMVRKTEAPIDAVRGM